MVAALNASFDEGPNEESLESIREAEDILVKGDLGYGSAEELFRAMGVVNDEREATQFATTLSLKLIEELDASSSELLVSREADISE